MNFWISISKFRIYNNQFQIYTSIDKTKVKDNVWILNCVRCIYLKWYDAGEIANAFYNGPRPAQ